MDVTQSVFLADVFGCFADDQRKLGLWLDGNAFGNGVFGNDDILSGPDNRRRCLEERLRHFGAFPSSQVAAVVKADGDHFVGHHRRENLDLIEAVSMVGYFVVLVGGGGDLRHLIALDDSVGYFAVGFVSGILGHFGMLTSS